MPPLSSQILEPCRQIYKQARTLQLQRDPFSLPSIPQTAQSPTHHLTMPSRPFFYDPIRDEWIARDLSTAGLKAQRKRQPAGCVVFRDQRPHVPPRPLQHYRHSQRFAAPVRPRICENLKARVMWLARQGHDMAFLRRELMGMGLAEDVIKNHILHPDCVHAYWQGDGVRRERGNVG